MKPYHYSYVKDNLIITLVAVLITITISIVIWYRLWDTIGTLGSIALTLFVSSGFVGMVGVDDWLIWYKSWIVNKFSNTKGDFILKVYDQHLKKYWLTTKLEVISTLYDQEQNPYFQVRIENRLLYMTFNPFTGNPSLCSDLGYKYGKKLYSIDLIYSKEHSSSEILRDIVSKYFNLYQNDLSVSFNPDSFYYKNKVHIS